MKIENAQYEPGKPISYLSGTTDGYTHLPLSLLAARLAAALLTHLLYR